LVGSMRGVIWCDVGSVGEFGRPSFHTLCWFWDLSGSSKSRLGKPVVSRVREDGSTGLVVQVWCTVFGWLMSIGTKLLWLGLAGVANGTWICLSFAGMVFCRPEDMLRVEFGYRCGWLSWLKWLLEGACNNC